MFVLGHSDQDQFRFEYLEFFVGKAEATRMFKYGGFRTGRLDKDYMSVHKGRMNPMDLLTDAGMALLGCMGT